MRVITTRTFVCEFCGRTMEVEWMMQEHEAQHKRIKTTTPVYIQSMLAPGRLRVEFTDGSSAVYQLDEPTYEPSEEEE